MKLINFTLLLFIIATVSCSRQNIRNNTSEAKPNVVLVITDDQGYGDLGAHGNTIIQTPNLDAFHAESYHLTDFHVGPTCAPTRSALMTGRDANSTGVWHTIGGWSLLREDEKTMADMFSEAGYATGGFGKWHMGDNYPFRPEYRGFQHTVMHGGGGVQQTPDFWNNTYFDDVYFNNGKPVQYKGYCTDVFFDEAISFIKDNKNKPFFCYIASNAPHGPFNVPVSYYDLYKDLSADVLQDTQKRFYGMITNVDENFGKLRKTLKELQVADNTILIFMTDNGTAAGQYYNKKTKKSTGFNAGMRGHKGSQYEGGHRVPFFIHWKNGNIYQSTDINELTGVVDVLPTLAELCGISLPKNHKELAGESIVPMLKNPDTTNERMLITDSQRIQVPEKWRGSAVMQQKWRLIDGKELYNLEKDKGQRNNLADKFPEKVTEMRSFYEKWWKKVSVDFEKEIYFKVGLDIENPIALTCHDIHAANGNQPWNQIAIRNGDLGKGYWCLDIKKSGKYKVSLRRYPIESDLNINATIPAITKKELPGLDRELPIGKNLQYSKASVKIGEIYREVSVSDTDKSADFIMELPSGKTKMNANFYKDEHLKNVAYYVYIEKL
ncbi:arylsulfatase [Flavicella marina]|uniref:arylsulfatase n=1 Tax=Flavicella marina TaxID=1475951 RepID=UPI001264EDD0|nr:arylsulfatase [Flavicella marina]